MKLTSEQQAFLSMDIDFKIVFVIALAGSGKTTILKWYTRQMKQWRFLYLAFNNSIVKESRQAFPTNVSLSTGHSIAYQAVGHHFKETIIPDLYVTDIGHIVSKINPNLKGGELYGVSQVVLKTLNKYLSSASVDFEGEHIDPESLNYINSCSSMEEVLDMAVDVWNAMCDISDKSIGMLHDGYLKIYQLSNPVLDYDCILLDESQDANPVMLDILFRQKARLILVGDPYQSIYLFRGAVNAFERIKACKTFYLTTSFRFGEDIARVANNILGRLGSNIQKVKGFGEDEIVEVPDMLSSSEPFMDISRSATGVIYASFKRKTFYEKHDLARDFHFVGGIGGYNLRRFICAYNLSIGQCSNVYTPSLKMFKTWGEFEETAIQLEDPQMLSLFKLVEQYKSAIVASVQNFKKMNETAKNADVFISTTHKSKGLESDNVLVRGDHDSSGYLGECDGSNESLALRQEVHLAYVAVTRARRKLAIESSPFADSVLG